MGSEQRLKQNHTWYTQPVCHHHPALCADNMTSTVTARQLVFSPDAFKPPQWNMDVMIRWQQQDDAR